MTRITLLAGLCCILVACATAAKPTTPPVTAVCIPLGNVSTSQQTAASAVLKGLTASQQNALAPIFSDWLHMRDADRACLAGASAPAAAH